jgi:hypothetical protein
MKNYGKPVFIILMVIALTLIGLSFINFSENEVLPANEFDNYAPIRAVVLPDEFYFAGERAPSELFYVKEHIDRELTVNTYWHSSTLLWLKRAGRWFPVIEPILKKEGIPEDFKYLALIESGLTQAVSPSGAAGFWQFLKGTAKDYDLEISKDVDERYHVERSTMAACRYLKDSYEKYGNWTLVAAAFNAGNRRISESLEEQKGKSYYDLRLNEETARYVYRILAAKEIYRNPENYGFFLSSKDLYKPVKVDYMPVTESIDDLAAFAQSHNISYRMLKELNPWLISNRLKVSAGNTYLIAIPQGS